MATTDSAATKSGRLQFEHNTRTTKATNLHRMLKLRTLLSLALFPLKTCLTQIDGITMLKHIVLHIHTEIAHAMV